MDTQTINQVVNAYIADHPLIIAVFIWSATWKLIAMWKAAKKNHLTVFIVLMFLQTIGIAEIGYLIFLYFKNKSTQKIS